MLPWHPVRNDTVELLTGERSERFEFERAIRLFEFQTWIYWPSTNKPNTAGMMAATLILESIEEDIFCDESAVIQQEANPDPIPLVDLTDKPNATLNRINVLRTNKQYRQVHDYIFATRGGLIKLLYCPSPKQFDVEVLNRQEKVRIIADLIDYRLRHAQHGNADGYGNINHAVFFKWWPTHEVPGRRGVTVQNKSPSPKTLYNWWQTVQPSSIFIYLNERHQHSQVPRIGDVVFEGSKSLIAAANDVDGLRRFFGAYAYIAETVQAAGGEKPVVIVPATVPRVEILTAQFTQTELQTIADYANNYLLMNG